MQGGCQCGAVRYRLAEPPVQVYICHCTECRRQSASAFGISVYVAREAFRLTQGTPRRWTRPATVSGVCHCHFCPDCGVRIWHEGADEPTLSVKGGTLDTPPDLSRAIHIWTSSGLPGLVIPPGAEAYPDEPPE